MTADQQRQRYQAARELERSRQHLRENRAVGRATLTDQHRVADAWRQWQVTS